MKIMLVDDEDLELAGLDNMLRQLDLPVEIVAKTWNGKLAVDLARETKPDVIISDVRMPIMGGVEFVRIIRPELPDALVVMISGHEDFAAIHRALNLGVDAWLVKPLDRSELIRLLRSRCEDKQGFPMRALPGQPQKVSALFPQIDAVRHLFSGSGGAGAEDWETRAGLPNSGQFVALAALPANRSALLEAVSLEALAPDDISTGPFQMPDGNIAMLLTYSAAMDETLLMNQIERYTEGWKDLLSAAYHSAVSVGVSLVHTGAAAFPAMYRQAVKALQDQEIYGRNKILFYAHPEGGKAVPVDISLASVMQTGDVEMFFELLKERMEALRHMRDLAQARTACIQLIHELSVQGAANVKWRLFAASFEKDTLEKIIRSETLPELTELIRRHMEQWGRQMGSERVSRSQQIVEEVAAIVEAHLAGDLSSEAIAERIYLTPSHIRRVVKNVMGITLQDYVLKMRMQRARELLASPALRVADVAIQTGYESVSYFGLVFRKFYGFTPGEYKQQMRFEGS